MLHVQSGVAMRELLAAIGIVSAVMLMVWFGDTSNPPIPQRQSESATQAPNNNQRGSRELPLYTRAVKTAQELNEEAEDRYEKHKSDVWLVRFTGLLTLFTAGLFVATALLWGATKRLVEGGEDTAKRQLRAYVGVSVDRLSNFNSKADIGIGMTLSNHG
ncbi:MAG TPA: hypothetical protein VMC06_10800, partial [Opitutaceae bacterium]|nr:hypothetical protein [Opitutaceae bacterium]